MNQAASRYFVKLANGGKYADGWGGWVEDRDLAMEFDLLSEAASLMEAGRGARVLVRLLPDGTEVAV